MHVIPIIISIKSQYFVTLPVYSYIYINICLVMSFDICIYISVYVYPVRKRRLWRRLGWPETRGFNPSPRTVTMRYRREMRWKNHRTTSNVLSNSWVFRRTANRVGVKPFICINNLFFFFIRINSVYNFMLKFPCKRSIIFSPP